jgi:hypothetical protein
MASQSKPTKKRSRKKTGTNPDLRPRHNFPLPPVDEIERRLRAVLTPGSFAARRIDASRRKMRDRILTLPVMAALVVSLVWRQMPSLAEALRIIAQEGLWDFGRFEVSRQALSQRLRTMPAAVFAQLYEESLAHLRQKQEAEAQAAADDRLAGRFTALWAADGSTLEALRRRVKEFRDSSETVLGGKMLTVVDLFTRRPQQTWYTTQELANDKNFCAPLLEALPVGGLVVLDLGWFSFAFFDALTEAGKYFVTRQREKTAYRVVEVLGESSHWRDEIIEMGMYRANPCRHRLRQVSVLWGTTWHRYLTNVLEADQLSPREVAQLYRQRWRIEEAFLLTKRLLGLSYLWVGDRNGVEIQLYATWLFYAVLSDLCREVAQALGEALEQISVEMVFRSLYHYSRAIDRGENPELIAFLVEHAQLFALVKTTRKRHREKGEADIEIWGHP